MPDKARPFSDDIQKDGRKAVVVHDVAKVCRATHEVELKDTPSVRGMIHKVEHLVKVEEVEA